MKNIHHGGSALKSSWPLVNYLNIDFNFQSVGSEGEPILGNTHFPARSNNVFNCYYVKGEFQLKTGCISMAVCRNTAEFPVIIPVELRYYELTGNELIFGLGTPIDVNAGVLVNTVNLDVDNQEPFQYHHGAFYDYTDSIFGGSNKIGLFFCAIPINFLPAPTFYATGACVLITAYRKRV